MVTVFTGLGALRNQASPSKTFFSDPIDETSRILITQ